MKKPIIVLIHIGYWLVFLFLLYSFYGFLWPLITGFDKHKMLHMALFWWGRLMIGFALVPGAISFYGFYFPLFDRYLKKRKIGLFVLGAVITAAVATLAGAAATALCGFPLFQDGFRSAFEISSMIFIMAKLNGVVGIIIRGFITWYGDIRIKETLRARNAEMELALVKSRISPHFLFNTLNNIDTLITTDPARASEYLVKLSDIMRFMLYETHDEKIPLQQELASISKYLELQKLRTANAEFIQYEVLGQPGQAAIAPMLFIPFIENAFKHSENKKIDHGISIRFIIDAQTITFECKNHYMPGRREQAGGMGNDLIQKRLKLLYPGRHTLQISADNNIYDVKLTVNLA